MSLDVQAVVDPPKRKRQTVQRGDLLNWFRTALGLMEKYSAEAKDRTNNIKQKVSNSLHTGMSEAAIQKYAESNRAKRAVEKYITGTFEPYFSELHDIIQKITEETATKDLEKKDADPQWYDMSLKFEDLLNKELVPLIDEYEKKVDELVGLSAKPATEPPAESAASPTAESTSASIVKAQIPESTPTTLLLPPVAKEGDWDPADSNMLKALESKINLYADSITHVNELKNLYDEYGPEHEQRPPKLLLRVNKFIQESAPKFDKDSPVRQEIEKMGENLTASLEIDRGMRGAKLTLSEASKSILKQYEEAVDRMIKLGNEARGLLKGMKETSGPLETWPGKRQRPLIEQMRPRIEEELAKMESVESRASTMDWMNFQAEMLLKSAGVL
jgi:hypothetical protein